MVVCPTCNAAYEEERNFCGRCGSDMRRAPPAAAEPDPWIGRVVDGRYRVLERIGTGGMGAVYRVEHVSMGKIAAMKVLHGELAAEREAHKRFRREAEAVSRLAHPNTVQVFDFGQVGSALYLVMEFVRGEDLGKVLRRDQVMTFARAAPILIQVCGSLGEAHDLGIVHRDLKPENIMVTRTKDGSDFVKVLDFGLAKMREREELASVTARGSLVGTPYYMSPEQIRSEGVPDARSDVYSLGALMYRMLAGEPPFTAQTPVAVLTKHLTEDPQPPRARRPDLDIPGLCETIVLRALQKRPADRYQTIDEMRAALERARAPVTEPPVAPQHGGSKGALSARRASDLPALSDADSSEWQLGTGPTSKMRSMPEAAAVDRLSRSDYDRYERSLKRQKYVRLLVLPILLGGLVVAGVWGGLRLRKPRPLEVEMEPNDDPAHANPISSGHPVRGKIGQRLSRDEGDVDVYRIPPAPGGPNAPTRVLRAEVTGIPNMDLVLEVFNAQGELLARADAHGVGEGELLPNLRLSSGENYLVVREARVPGSAPTENVTDEYALSASWHTLGEHEEAEPNDAPGQVTRLRPGLELSGYLDHRGDVDTFLLDAPAGTHLRGQIILPTGVAARVRIGEEPEREIPPLGELWRFEALGGQTLRLERHDPPPGRLGDKSALPGLGQPYRILVR